MVTEIHSDEYFPIPFTDGQYVISKCGIVVKSATNKKIEKDPTDKVGIFLFSEHRVVKVSFLVALTFKKPFDVGSFILDWEVLFADGNDKNLSINNLLWKPPLGGQECPIHKGYYIIPFYTRYAISREGKVISRLNHVELSVRKASPDIDNSYLNFSARPDGKPKSVLGQHRALGLAFLPYDENVVEMTINHKDGIKFNNAIGNLEWSTYSQNNIHAMDAFLRTSRIPVLLKDYYNGEIHRFKSISHAATFLGINSGYVYEIINGLKLKEELFDFRYKLIMEKDFIRWPVYDAGLLKLEADKHKKWSEQRACIATNVYTMKSVIAENPRELRIALGIGMTKDEVHTALSTPNPWPIFNHVFQYLHEAKPIRDFSKEELECFKDKKGILKPIRVTKSAGEVRVFLSASIFSESMGLPKRLIGDLLYQNNGIHETEDFKVEVLT